MNGNGSLRSSSGELDFIQPPYRWATNLRAVVHSLRYLSTHNINTIKGRLKCKRCGDEVDLEYDLMTKFQEVATFIVKSRDEMRDRAPDAWMMPVLPDCGKCEKKNSMKPVMGKKRNINWLFLFLGQMVGCCKLNQLKYFCKHNKIHRTGAKNRILYTTYMKIMEQLEPTFQF